MRSLLAILLIFGFYACQPAENTATADSQTESEIKSGNAYTLTSVPGTDLVQATKYNEAQQVVETGFFLNNLPEGTWKFYNPAKPEFPNKVISYHQGIKQGLYLELSERGDVTLKANYLNDQLNGSWGMYKFGRPLKTANYLNDQLDGPYREYTANMGKLQREIYYKMGMEDGPYRYYNDDGEITVEYEYKNGEKVSGGLVE